MKTDLLFNKLLTLKPFPEELRDQTLQTRFREHLENIVAETHYDQKHLILSAGEIAERAYFIRKGLVRGFTYHPDTGREITLFFRGESMITMAANSYFLRQPSRIFLEVMPGSILQSTSWQQAREAFRLFPAAEAFTRIVTLEYNAFHTQRTLDLLTRTAWERYLDMRATYPGIEQMVSQETIASYLGITRPSLSRLISRYGHP